LVACLPGWWSGDPAGDQRFAGRSEAFHLVELGPPAARGLPAHCVRIQRGDQLGELPANPNQTFEHVSESKRPVRQRARPETKDVDNSQDIQRLWTNKPPRRGTEPPAASSATDMGRVVLDHDPDTVGSSRRPAEEPPR
jgi:hypothetical protein